MVPRFEGLGGKIQPAPRVAGIGLRPWHKEMVRVFGVSGTECRKVRDDIADGHPWESPWYEAETPGLVARTGWHSVSLPVLSRGNLIKLKRRLRVSRFWKLPGSTDVTPDANYEDPLAALRRTVVGRIQEFHRHGLRQPAGTGMKLVA